MTSFMAETQETDSATAAAEKDLVTRLADAGEEALPAALGASGRAAGRSRLQRPAHRVDELAKKVRGIDALEARVAKLEKEVSALKKPKTSARTTTRKPSS